MRKAASLARGAIAAAALAVVAACLPGTGPLLNEFQDDAGQLPPTVVIGDGGVLGDVNLGDPFTLVGLLPSHGPFSGGTHATISGRGFSSNVQVWFGGAEVDPNDVFASSPTRVSVVSPPGQPGPVPVRLRNVATGQERVLPAGFVYDAFDVSPDAGATAGGTRIALHGSGTRWAPTSTVSVGGQPCAAVTVAGPTDLTCTTPPGSPGATDVTVHNADGSTDQAREVYTYGDSSDGYRGGLFGNALAGSMTVIAFDSDTSTPLAGGTAIAGSNLATATTAVFDATGVARINSPSLQGKVTVTVAAKCHQPTTFVDVPVDTVTAYLNPILDPSCGGDPPVSGAGAVVLLGQVSGELVWKGGVEFELAPWTNVPAPQGNERMAAYLFPATGNPLEAFQLPPASNAVTPDARAVVGYSYTAFVRPGNQTLYAVAGLEDRSVSPPRFQAYALGVARGILVQPGASTLNIDIPMDAVFDHTLATVPNPPAGSPAGPDRLLSTLAIDLGAGQFAVLPQGTTTSLLPAPGGVDFVGVPALSGSLANAAYNVTAQAVTGAAASPPLSVVSQLETTDANDPLRVAGFLGVPTPIQPPSGAWDGRHVAMQVGGSADLAVVNVTSGNGLVTWTIVAPGNDLRFEVPDLAQVAGVGTLARGPITTNFYAARVPSFSYDNLRYGQISTRAWSAYAQNVTAGSY
ncbi:MAG: IPT/TIG domain-containing protein [Myxococcales bacterium]|nr:IPT/TIG domain-containing protein [Myxococcales bacterium]